MCPRPQGGIDVVESQNVPNWKGPLRITEYESFWTRSINAGENIDIPAVGQVCFRGVLFPLLRAHAGPPGRDNEPDHKKVQAANPTGCEQQDWSGQGHVRERQLCLSTCLSENPGPGERCSLEPFGCLHHCCQATKAGVWDDVFLGQEDPDSP